MRKRSIILAAIFTVSVFLLGGCGKRDVKVEPTTDVAPIVSTEKEPETIVKEKETEPTTEAATEEAYSSDYSLCTSKSDEEVEAYAERITDCFAREDWKTLADMIYYPIIINETYYANKEEFLKTDWSNVFTQEYKDEMACAATTDLWASWKGIAVGNALINELYDEKILCIGSLYYSDGLEHKGDGKLYGEYTMDYDMTTENLQDYTDLTMLFGNGLSTGTLFTIEDTDEGIVFNYYIGIAAEGDGYAYVDESSVTLNESTGDRVVGYEKIDGQMYLMMPMYGETVYWKKLQRPLS